MNENERKEAQALRAERMQDMILEHLEKKLKDGSITATELKTAVDLLRANGWDFNQIVTKDGLGSKLTKLVAYDDLNDHSSLKH